MGKRIHGKVYKKINGRSRLVYCNGRLKTRMSGMSCDCGARRECY